MSQVTADFAVQLDRNRVWNRSNRGRRITVVGDRFVGPNTKLFAMGSCFAVEIRKSLRSRGREVYPDYLSLEFDPRTQSPAKLPERDNVNHYDTFLIRQEIERTIEERPYEKSDFWTLKEH